MRRSKLVILAILALIPPVVRQWTPTVSAQGCPPSSYTNQVFPWASGTTVNFSFDVFGLNVQDPSNPNPNPKFDLSETNVQNLSSGIQQWNDKETVKPVGGRLPTKGGILTPPGKF